MQGVVTRYLQVIYYIIVKPNFTMMLWYLKWSLNSTFFGTFQLFQSEFCRKQTASYPVSPVPPRIPCWGRDKCGNSKKKKKKKRCFYSIPRNILDFVALSGVQFTFFTLIGSLLIGQQRDLSGFVCRFLSNHWCFFYNYLFTSINFMHALVNAHLKHLIVFFFLLHVRISLQFPFLITFTKRSEHLLNGIAV